MTSAMKLRDTCSLERKAMTNLDSILESSCCSSNTLRPMDCSTLGFPVLYQLPELAQTHPLSQRCHSTISSSVFHFSSCLQSFPALRSFPMNQLFPTGGQSIGASASTSILPVNIQCCFRYD